MNYMENNNTMICEFIAIDGDSIGKLLEKYILTNDLDRLSVLSTNIQSDIDTLSIHLQENHGYVIMKGGDNILCQCNLNSIEVLVKEILLINKSREYHFSAGIANSAVNAYMALKYAKLSGNTVVRFYTEPDNSFEILHR